MRRHSWVLSRGVWACQFCEEYWIPRRWFDKDDERANAYSVCAGVKPNDR